MVDKRYKKKVEEKNSKFKTAVKVKDAPYKFKKAVKVEEPKKFGRGGKVSDTSVGKIIKKIKGYK